MKFQLEKKQKNIFNIRKATMKKGKFLETKISYKKSQRFCDFGNAILFHRLRFREVCGGVKKFPALENIISSHASTLQEEGRAKAINPLFVCSTRI